MKQKSKGFAGPRDESEPLRFNWGGKRPGAGRPSTGPHVMVCARLNVDLVERLKDIAEERKTSLSNVIETLLFTAVKGIRRGHFRPSEEFMTRIREVWDHRWDGQLDHAGVIRIFDPQGNYIEPPHSGKHVGDLIHCQGCNLDGVRYRDNISLEEFKDRYFVVIDRTETTEEAHALKARM